MSTFRANLSFLKKLTDFLEERGIRSALPEAEAIARHVSGADRVAFLTGEMTLTAAQRARVMKLARKRVKGQPLAYVFGETEFYGYSIRVSRSVLVPRPETEILVERVLSAIEAVRSPSILDFGTGSGCIALSLTMRRADCKITALDRSAAALKVARMNFEKHKVARRIRLVKSLGFGAFLGMRIRRPCWDVVVANPPYIPEEDYSSLPSDVLREPKIALTGGPGGLDVIKEILDQAPFFIKNGGWLLMEIGDGQAAKLESLLRNKDWISSHSFTKDLAGVERVLEVQKVS